MKRTHQLASVRPRGFTLVELMVVIVLIAILSAMIVPQMAGTFEDALLRSASRELVSAFTLASSHAVSHNEQLRVRFEARTGRYRIEKRAETGEAPPDAFVPVKELPFSEGRIDERISVEIRLGGEPSPEAAQEESAPESEPGARSGADQIITFYPDGTAEAGEIRLRDRSGFRRTLRINPTTARVRIIAGEPREGS